MKNVLFTFLMALISVSANAQRKGDFAVGLRGGPSIARFEFSGEKESYTRWGAGAFAQYNLSNSLRFDLDAIYHPKKDGLSDITAGLNLQYLVDVADAVKVYPLVGYAIAFVHEDGYYYDNGHGVIIEHDSENESDGGIQLGAGIQCNLGDNWFLSGEYRFQPGILGDCHVILASIGLRF